MKTLDYPFTNLARAVLDQMGYTFGTDYAADDAGNLKLDDEAYEYLSNIRSANDGYNGFIYYYDTEKFALEHRELIRDSLRELADSIGEGLIECVRSFNSLKNYKNIEGIIGRCLFASVAELEADPDEEGCIMQVLNSLAWYALEEVAYHIGDAEILDDPDNADSEEA